MIRCFQQNDTLFSAKRYVVFSKTTRCFQQNDTLFSAKRYVVLGDEEVLSTPSTVTLVTAKKQNSCSARTRARRKQGGEKKEEREVNKVVLQVSQQKTSLRD